MSKKKKYTPLVFLVLLKWLAELIYFVGIVFVAGTALLLLTYNILNIPLNYIHIAALIASFIYILVGFLVANSSEDIVIASNYFKILSAGSTIQGDRYPAPFFGIGVFVSFKKFIFSVI